jgi:large subunit ribosomal protein L16
MLMPKRVKRRMLHRGNMKGRATRGNTLAYGDFGLVALEPAWITSNQIESARVTMSRYTKRGGKIWIKIFPHKPITKQPIGKRMGGGKGQIDSWVAVVQPDRVLFEMAGINEADARRALELASYKLPIKTKFIKREVETKIVEEGGEK